MTQTEQPTKIFNRNFLLMMQGSLVSNLGDVLYSIAVGWYVYELTGSEAMLGIFTSITMFATMILSPLAGAIADKVDRKSMLVVTDALRGLVMLAIGALCLAQRLGVGSLTGLTAVVAVAGVFFNPCVSTVMMDIVPRDELIRARSVDWSIIGVVQFVGKAVSGFLIAFAGVGWLIVFNGVSFLLSALSECFIKVPRTPRQGEKLYPAQLLRDMRDGFATVVKTAGLARMFACALAINLLASGVFGLLLIFTQQSGYSLQQYGIMMSAMSLGSIAGTLLMSLVKFSPPARLRIFVLGFISTSVLCAAALLCGEYYLACALLAAAELLNICANMVVNAAMMLAIPQSRRAAALGFITASSTGGSALSAVIYGFLAGRWPLATVGSAGVALALAPILLMVASPRVRELILNSDAPPPEHNSEA